MTYNTARNGQVFGPYTHEQVQQYMSSGNIVASDLVQAEGSTEWLPVAQVFPLASVGEAPGAPDRPRDRRLLLRGLGCV